MNDDYAFIFLFQDGLPLTIGDPFGPPSREVGPSFFRLRSTGALATCTWYLVQVPCATV